MVSFFKVIRSSEKIVRTGGGTVLEGLLTVSSEIIGQIVEVQWVPLRSPAKQRRSKRQRERKEEC